MKTLQLIAMFMLISSAALMAQEKETALKEISHNEVPGTILAALENDFSGAKVKAYYILPVDLYQHYWAVMQTKEAIAKGESGTHYLIEFDADPKHSRVVYDVEGVLMQKREVIKGADLPKSISDYINAKYKGYTITKDKELVRTSKDGTIDHYKIKIKKDKWVKSLYFNGKGELVKEREG